VVFFGVGQVETSEKGDQVGVRGHWIGPC
jgi:hypothetical protein